MARLAYIRTTINGVTRVKMAGHSFSLDQFAEFFPDEYFKMRNAGFPGVHPGQSVLIKKAIYQIDRG
jgi:hypothetical protein